MADQYLRLPGEAGKSEFLVKTLSGLEDELLVEMQEMGLTRLRKATRGVWFKGNMHDLMRANYGLRLALRVIMPIAKFTAYDDRRLHKKAEEVAWEDFILLDDTFAIDSNVRSSIFTHSHYAGLLIKDAIVDRFNEKYEARPNVDTRSPTWRIDLHIDEQEVTLSIDASGDSLHKRGYRLLVPGAPVNEVLAAGMVHLSRWNPKAPLIDPMCGSGTILAEAWMYAKRMAPQKFRRKFAFEAWPDYDKEAFEKIKQSIDAQEVDEDPIIMGRDTNEERLRSAVSTLKRLGCENPQFEKADFMKTDCPEGEGVMITNPPYDIRIQVEDIAAFFNDIGSTLKHKWPGWRACIIAPEGGPFKRIGLKPDKKHNVHNGQIACKFQVYTLFSGKRKENLR